MYVGGGEGIKGTCRARFVEQIEDVEDDIVNLFRDLEESIDKLILWMSKSFQNFYSTTTVQYHKPGSGQFFGLNVLNYLRLTMLFIHFLSKV